MFGATGRVPLARPVPTCDTPVSIPLPRDRAVGDGTIRQPPPTLAQPAPPSRPRGPFHGGACLRRAMFATRTASQEPTTPPRSLPAGSDVPGCDRSARRPAASHATRPPRRKHRSTWASRAVTRHVRATRRLVRNTAPRRRAPRWPRRTRAGNINDRNRRDNPSGNPSTGSARDTQP